MYCKKCGCRIQVGIKKCSNCGIDVSNIEYCGGFWGLVGEDVEKKIEDLSIDMVDEEVSQEIEKEKIPQASKKNPFFFKLVSGIAIILLLLCAIQSMRLSHNQKKYQEYYSQYMELDTKYNELEDEYEKLSEEYKEVQKEYKEVQKEDVDLSTNYKKMQKYMMKRRNQQKKEGRNNGK